MYNVLIFGTGSTANLVTNSLNKDINVVAYVDNNQEKWNKVYLNKKIVSPINIKNMCYDYIIIASQYNEDIYQQLLSMKINKDCIFQFYKFMDMYNKEFVHKLNIFKQNSKNITSIATGISYTDAGLKEELLKSNCVKFAMSSQDLYYDYNIFKYILNNYENNIKYALIGLSYYSFQYDLSLCGMKNKVIKYYSVLNLYHHFKDVKEIYGQYDVNEMIANKLFTKDTNGEYQINNLKYEYDMKKNGEIQAKIDCNKNYPKTVQENKQIFKQYLDLLKKNNIKPIVIVFPVSKYYSEYFSKRIENEFKLIINEFKEKYDFQYIDYFRSTIFDDEDFHDVSHLNKKGACKVTSILNNDIKW